MSDVAGNVELAKGFNEAGQRGDIEAAIEFVDEDVVAAEVGSSLDTPTVFLGRNACSGTTRNDQLAYRFAEGRSLEWCGRARPKTSPPASCPVATGRRWCCR